jgi:hypothetical protein
LAVGVVVVGAALPPVFGGAVDDDAPGAAVPPLRLGVVVSLVVCGGAVVMAGGGTVGTLVVGAVSVVAPWAAAVVGTLTAWSAGLELLPQPAIAPPVPPMTSAARSAAARAAEVEGGNVTPQTSSSYAPGTTVIRRASGRSEQRVQRVRREGRGRGQVDDDPCGTPQRRPRG